MQSGLTNHWDTVGRRAVLVMILAAAACDIPQDSRDTLAEATGDTLHVGVTEARPWVIRQGEEPSPVVLGRLKLSIAEELHEKTLKADADMNKADWMTAVAAILGVLGIGIGLWWADSVAALVISLDVLKDGVTHVRAVFSDLMDQRPTTADRTPQTELIQKTVDALERLHWVRDADIRLHEEGVVLAGEAFVVPTEDGVTLAQLKEATRAVHDVDWKIYDVVVTAVETVDRRRDPRQGEREPVR